MNKTKLLVIIVLGLLASNLVLVFYIYSASGNRSPKRSKKELISKQLNFTQTQIRDYEELIKQHRSDINATDLLIRQHKKQLYKGLINHDQIQTDSIINMLGQLQIRVEKIHYNHFLDIKSLCSEKQIDYFDHLTNELDHLFTHPPRRHPDR